MKKTFVLLVVGVIVLVLLASYFREVQQESNLTKETASLQEDEVQAPSESENKTISFRSLIERSYQAPALQQRTVLQETASYTKYAATYQSDTYTISGVLYIPKGKAPEGGFPVLVTNHGYIDPAVYTTGRGLKREQEYFSSRGYIVFHPDYRNHAGSTKTGEDPVKDRLGYITDIIHAVESVKSSSLPVNKENITLLGHSMGGGATLSAALIKPDVANHIVLYAPVTVNYLDSYLRYQKDDPKRADRVKTLYGSPEENPVFWQGLNGEPYFDRLQIPVQIYHGTNDADVPYEWSTKTRDQLQARNKSVELITYPGEGHEFSRDWNLFMQGVLEFTKTSL